MQIHAGMRLNCDGGCATGLGVTGRGAAIGSQVAPMVGSAFAARIEAAIEILIEGHCKARRGTANETGTQWATTPADCAGRSTKPLPVDPTMDSQRRCNGVLAINVTRSRTQPTADCCRAARRPRHRAQTDSAISRHRGRLLALARG